MLDLSVDATLHSVEETIPVVSEQHAQIKGNYSAKSRVLSHFNSLRRFHQVKEPDETQRPVRRRQTLLGHKSTSVDKSSPREPKRAQRPKPPPITCRVVYPYPYPYTPHTPSPTDYRVPSRQYTFASLRQRKAENPIPPVQKTAPPKRARKLSITASWIVRSLSEDFGIKVEEHNKEDNHGKGTHRRMSVSCNTFDTSVVTPAA